MAKKVIAIIHTDEHLDLDNIPTWKSCMKQGDDLARNYNVPLFLLGDLFESRKGQPQDLFNTVHDYFKEGNIERYIIPGNHDKQDYESERSFLDAFEFHPNLRIIKNHGFVDLEGVRFHLIPYFLEGPIYTKWLNLSKRFFHESKKNILGTHIAIINGGKNNDGEVILKGIDPADFLGFDSVLCGHYHDKNSPYIGSLFQQNFSEDNRKGFTILYNDGSYELKKSDFKEYVTIELNLDKLSQLDIEKIKESALKSGNYIRFEFSGALEKIKTINQSSFKTLGIDVKIKRDKIDKGILESKVADFISLTSSSILIEFEKFCERNELNPEGGIKFLEKKLIK